MAAAYRLHYFDIPGRAETIRLIFTVAGIPFEDKCYTYSPGGKMSQEYDDFKARSPYGQLPVLEHIESGKLMAQSAVIEHYVAKQAGLLPSGDDWDAAVAESVGDFVMDIWTPIFSTMRIDDAAEKKKAREELMTSSITPRLKTLSSILEKSGGGFISGGKLSYVDIRAFDWLSQLTKGNLDGIPKDILDPYPAIQSFRHRIASLPAIKSYYEAVTEGTRMVYKPEAAVVPSPASAEQAL